MSMGTIYINCSLLQIGGSMIKYKRILLKVSGEALSAGHGIDDAAIKRVARQIKSVVDLGVQVGVVVGGGNFWRGRQNGTMDRATADYIGMLATVMNALALSEGLSACGVENEVVTAIAMDKIAKPYFLPDVLEYLEQVKWWCSVPERAVRTFPPTRLLLCALVKYMPTRCFAQKI